MKHTITKLPTFRNVTLGLDLGDTRSDYCVLDEEGTLQARGHVATTKVGLSKLFGKFEESLIAFEVCGQSAWIGRVAKESGNQLIVADSRRMALITKNINKSDANDCELLARLARSDCNLLNPIEHRSEKTQADREVLAARLLFTRTRTRLVNHLRQVTKLFGKRIPSCSVECIHKRAVGNLPEEVEDTLNSVISVIEILNEKIKSIDDKIKDVCVTEYPHTALFRAIGGVGYLIALAFALTIENPYRFKQSRQVGPYIGLVPRRAQSGSSDPQLRITKAGDREMRRLLVLAANYIMGQGPDCDLRRFGEKLAARGGKNARKRAKVAVARKLAVLMHRLWITGEVYDPLYLAKRNSEEAAA